MFIDLVIIEYVHYFRWKPGVLFLRPEVEALQEKGVEEKLYAREVVGKVVQTDQEEVQVLPMVSL